ncbi:MAG: bifunctional oligoribonuclease/PAP phosphatase NrnA [Acidobacteriia bacterium]|nr:bifunctional oligoribonuclease/PAP phosphatase NrnA [Terriglobia bacterium]
MVNAEQCELFRRLTGIARRYVLTTHMNPDGDAIGSEVGLARLLAGTGRELRIVNQEATPRNLAYLEDLGPSVEVYDPAVHDAALDAADLVVLLDNSAPDRLGRMEPAIRSRASKVFCIDHHPTPGTLWAHDVLDEQASATAAIVYELSTAAGHRIDLDTAEALYAGLSTDTGFFRFNSTRARAHEIAAALLRTGIEPSRCFREVYERNSPAWTRLLGRALAGLRLDAGGAIVSVRVTRAMESECDAEGADTSEMTTPLLAIEGVRIALLFRELPEGRVKVSLRSKGDLDVYRLAAEFGGGGHRNASGIVADGRLDEMAETVIAGAAGLLAASPGQPA